MSFQNEYEDHNESGSFKTKGSSKASCVIDREDYQYINEIRKNLKRIVDDEEQSMMADNFIENSTDKEIAFAAHPIASASLESLVPHSSPEVFEKFTAALLPNLRVLVNDKNASFVLETSMKTATLRALTAEPSEASEETEEPSAKKKKFSKVSTLLEYNLNLDVKLAHKTYCTQFVEKISKFLLNNLEEYLYENNANHLLRSCLHCLSGCLSQKNHFQKVDIINLKTKYGKTVPDEWNEVLGDFATRLMSWPQFADLAFDESSSVFLQVLCQALKNIESQHSTLKKLIKTIMRNSFKDENESEDPEEFKAFSSPASLRLLESMMDSCDEKLLNKIYKKYFKTKLIDLSESPNLNFAVQRLVDATTDKETFEETFNALTPEFEKLLQIGNTGVVFAVCKACEKLGVKQGQFIQSLLRSLDCAGEKSNRCILPIISLTPLNIIEEKDEAKITLHGSLILQHIFQFNKPIKIVQSLLEMKPQDIANILCDQKGSRIADAYLESKFIGEKSREKLIKLLEGMYLKMALSKAGSHVLEKFYNQSSDTHKEVIVQELSERVNQLNGCVSGRIIAYKFSVDAYARNKNQWRGFLNRNAAKASR